MTIVGAFDLHRRQLTYDYLEVETGEVSRGRIVPADRDHLRSFLTRFVDAGEVGFSVEGCTGWRYVVEELERQGSGLISRSRQRQPPSGARSDGRRPIVPMPATNESC